MTNIMRILFILVGPSLSWGSSFSELPAQSISMQFLDIISKEVVEVDAAMNFDTMSIGTLSVTTDIGPVHVGKEEFSAMKYPDLRSIKLRYEHSTMFSSGKVFYVWIEFRQWGDKGDLLKLTTESCWVSLVFYEGKYHHQIVYVERGNRIDILSKMPGENHYVRDMIKIE